MPTYDLDENSNYEDAENLKDLAERFAQMAQNTEEDNKGVKRPSRAPKTPFSRFRPLITGIVIGLVIIGVLVFVLKTNILVSKIPTVPDVVGKPLSKAKDILNAANMKITGLQYDPDSQQTVGTIVKQNPPAGTVKTPRSSSIILMVAGKNPDKNKPPDHLSQTKPDEIKTTIPDIEGMETKKAKGKLSAAGLKYDETTSNDPEQPDRIVLKCDPTPGTQVTPGSTVHLTINALSSHPSPVSPPSTGNGSSNSATSNPPVTSHVNQPPIITPTPAPSRVPVVLENYAGKPASEVVKDLASKGLSPITVFDSTRIQSSGLVVKTDPPANTPVQAGERVTVTVAK